MTDSPEFIFTLIFLIIVVLGMTMLILFVGPRGDKKDKDNKEE